MESENCNCCGKVLSVGEEKKRRRLLSNPNLQTVYQTLTSLIAELSCVEEIDVAKVHTGYICRGCVGLVEKYQNLHRELSSKLSAALPSLPKMPAAAGTCTVSTGPVPLELPSSAASSTEQLLGATTASPVVSVPLPATRSPALTVCYLTIIIMLASN